MAFLNTQNFDLNEYELYVYLTEDGKNAFYAGGFNNRATYFSLGCNDINYSGNTDTINTALRGSMLDNTQTRANIGVEYDDIKNKIVHYPDVQLSESLDLVTFTVDSNGQKLFNNTFTNHPYHPIDLGSVSVTKGNNDETSYNRFYLMNKSPSSLYLDNIFFNSVEPERTHFPVNRRTIIPETGDTAFIEFDIAWFSDQFILSTDSAYYEGTLTLKVPKLYFEFNERVSLFPFQIFPFEVKYEVIAPGSPRFHYHGQTFSDPNIGGSGQLNFTITFQAIDEKRRIGDFNEVNQNVGIMCTVSDTGYDASTFEEPQLVYG